jgi:predicted DNA-binding WGR domain protein
VILHWRNPDNGRYYQAVVGEDLFGESFLWRGWCGANGRRGGEKQDVFTWEGDCLRALRRVIRRRERRGYVLLGGGRPLVCVQGEPSAAQEAREAIAGIDQAAEPLVQVPAGDALREHT